MAQSYTDIGKRQAGEESGGPCQMTIVTLVSDCGDAHPRDGTRGEGDGEMIGVSRDLLITTL